MIRHQRLEMTIRLAALGLVVLMLAAYAVGEGTPAHAGFTKYVDDDGGCIPNATFYPTITAALADQQPGDSIFVCPGEYEEPTLLITANGLTLTGPESGGVLIKMALPTDNGRAIFVNTGGTLITRLEIDGTPPAGYNGLTTGLRNGGDGNTLSHLTITNADYGIDVAGSEPRDNHIDQNNVTAELLAISCECNESSTITDNVVQSPDSDEITGIFATGATFEVSGNTLTRAQLGINGSNAMVTDNTIIGDGQTQYDLVGLYFGPITLAGNTIENAGRNAIGIYAPYFDTTVDIVRNTIRDSKNGIFTESQNDYNIFATIGTSAPEANTFENSGGTLTDTNYLFKQGEMVDGFIDATFNDWGLCNALDIEKEVYHRSDDGTLGTVDFNPFIAGPGCATPTPTPSPSASPTTSPTATPGGQQVQWGDITCNGTYGPEDGLAIAVDAAALEAGQDEPCPEIGAPVDVDGTSRLWGDFDCDGDVDLDDALKVIGAFADVEYDAPQGCPAPEQVVGVEG